MLKIHTQYTHSNPLKHETLGKPKGKAAHQYDLGHLNVREMWGNLTSLAV